MILSPGDRVDRYEVLELLGSGGMGEVYRARDPKLARDVALKMLRLDPSGGSEGAARLLREARVVASLSHAHVLAVYDVGNVREPERLRGLAYIAMEYVVGKSLGAYLGDEGVPLARRIGWLRDIASALGAAHKAGIVHRDVKPENVMVRADDGTVKVLDFGIARRAAPPMDAWSPTEGHSLATSDHPAASLPTLTGQGVVVGTPFYMAPEQLRGEPLDARADQFAWGVVAYGLLAGKMPWTAGLREPLALLSQILSVDPLPPSVVEPRISSGVSAVVMRTLQKVREARFASMDDLIDALDAESAPGSSVTRVSAAPSARAERVASPAVTSAPGGSPVITVMAVAGAAIAAVSAIAAGFAWSARPRDVGSVAAEAPFECTTNAECTRAHGGAAWHCNSRRHACVEVASADCTVYANAHDAEAADVVWIGGLFPLHTDPGLLCEARAAELARQDFAAALGASAERGDRLHARPIGFVSCDEGADAMRAARHLAEDVEVPAVIGFRSTPSALETIPAVLLPDRVLSMVTISQAPMVTRIPEPPGEPRLVWRTTLDRDESAVPLARFVSDVLEPAARAQAGGIGKAPMKVAALWASSATQDFMDAVFDALHFNERSALDNGTNFRQFAVGPGGDADVSEKLALFAPQVIVVGTELFFQDELERLESLWPKRAPRPVYVTESALSELTATFAGHDAERRRRFFAVTNVSSTPTNAKLVLRYNVAFPADTVVRTEAPQPSYDAFYALAYATYAVGDAPVTGPALASALGRLSPPGPAIDVGPEAIFEGFSALRSGGHIDLNGAIGSLDFDAKTGEAPIDYSFTCLGVDDRGYASRAVDSGLVYDTKSGRLVGALHCP